MVSVIFHVSGICKLNIIPNISVREKNPQQVCAIDNIAGKNTSR